MRGLAALVWWLCASLCAGLAAAEGEPAGTFDHYVLALSWSPTWCALDGDARAADQCDARHDHAWTLHGLWPQNERGWPSFCSGGGRDPSRAETAAMADIMGSAGLAWHQWQKHGRCSGMAGAAFLAAARRAFAAVRQPEALRRLGRPVDIDPEVVEAAFLAANPGLEAAGLALRCRAGRLAEVRLCLTRELRFRRCGPDVVDDCPSLARLDPVR